MQPRVQPFFHEASNTWSYVVAEPEGRAAAVIDPVLDFDAKSGRTATTAAQVLVDHVRALDLDVQWILETHAHADHLSAGRWLKTQWPRARHGIGTGIRDVQRAFAPIFNLGDAFPVDGSQFDHLFVDGEHFRHRHARGGRDRSSRPHQRQLRLPRRRCAVPGRFAVHARRRQRALRFPRWRRTHPVPVDPANVRTT
jgi:glyoxylase-like metal-dependent hydrolase (beta-lactamase superfamily II)